jgi:hypothetical protein
LFEDYLFESGINYAQRLMQGGVLSPAALAEMRRRFGLANPPACF